MSKKKILVLAIFALLLAGCVGAGNFVWLDENGNGIQDEGEPGVEGVTVRMIGDDGSAGEAVFTTVTDANGEYRVYDLIPFASPYFLEFLPPAGFSFTLQDQGGDDVDSDVDPATGRTPLFSVLVNNENSFDAGLLAEQAAAIEEDQEEEEVVPTATPTATPEPEAAAPQNVCYGPQQDSFPAGISPLSGLPVSDPTLLTYRPVFLSISIFPPSVRPPTGLAVSPIIYELYIGDGDTRLMAGFYGEFPEPAFAGVEGESAPAPEGFQVLFGDKVWFDSNGNHLQDEGEPGVSGVAVRLVDTSYNTVATTETDAAGYYYFGLNDVAINTEYQLRFGAPPTISDYYWVNKDLGADDIDSDVTSQGYTDFFDPTEFVNGQSLDLDAGLRQAYRIEGLRSGRVAYQDLQVNYCGCLVTAGADPAVAAQINTCASAFGSDPNNIGGAGLDVTRLQGVASSNTQGACAEPNLSGNLFCTQPSGEGQAGQELYVEYNTNNKNHFVYDEALSGYTWSINKPSDNQVFDLMTDRLTGETLSFENVVVLFVPHVAQNEAVTIINLQMQSSRGRAIIFRNGQMYEAEWSTQFPAYVTDRDQPIPVHFEVNGEPFALAPGQTWINLLNQGDTIESIGSGIWLADFDAPAYNP
jgi:hypothetical protein